MPGTRLTAHGSRFALLVGFAALALLLAARTDAQLNVGSQWPQPRLTALTPTGGKAGATFEVVFTGTECDQPDSLWFSHPGIKGTPIIPPPPKVDPKAKPDPNKKDTGPPPITKFNVAIDAAVPPGSYDVRLVNKNGISNPRVFVVGTLNEVAEKEPNNDVEQAQKVELGTTITGLINPGTDVDYTSFAGKKGQKVLITCLTAALDSKMDAEMTLVDATGREVVRTRALNGQDGVLDVTLPNDGDFTLRLNQFTYTSGGADHYYRLTIGTGPWIDSVFPPVIEPGKAAQVTLYGRNLPGGKVDPTAVLFDKPLETLTVAVSAPAEANKLNFAGVIPSTAALLDGFEYRFTGPTGVSNPKLITFAKAPVVIEKDDNDTPEKAQEVPAPCEIAGRIDKKRDRDWYVFNAKKGDAYVIELFSDRVGAPTDMYLSVRNLAAKQEMVLLDDTAETLSNRLFTGNSDPAPYKFVAPADGKFHLMVASHLADNQADPRHVYRIRVSPEKPDFRLAVMPGEDFRPDACVLGQGGSEYFTVYVQRLDGFAEDITLTVEGLPPGVTALPQVLSKRMKSTQLVLSATDAAAPFTGAIKVVGTATLKGQKIVHEARPATITWPVQNQQNIRTVTRLDRTLMLAVRDKAPGKLVATPDKLVVTHGDKGNVPLKLARVSPQFKAGNFQVQPVAPELPPGVTFANLTFAPGKDEQPAIVTVAPNVLPGTYNLVFRGFAPISPTDKAKPLNTILNSNPVTLTVLPKQVATLSFDNANPTVKVGAEAAITVKVARQFDYADAFKVEIALPPNTKGLDIANITIPPGANEAKLTIKAAQGTAPTNVQNITLKAVAVVNGNVNLNHEAKFNVNIVK